MQDFLLRNLYSGICIAVPCHDCRIGLGMCYYSGRSAHSCAGLIGYIYLLISCWWLECDCYGIFRWFLGCLYLLYGCIFVDAKVNVGIWYDWLLLCLFCCLELVRRVLWGLIFVAIRSIYIYSYDIYVSNKTTSEVCEDKLIWLILC